MDDARPGGNSGHLCRRWDIAADRRWARPRTRRPTLQISTMNASVRAAELLAIAGRAAMMADDRAAASVAIDEARLLRAHLLEVRTQSHALVEARRVGRERDGRAHFAQLFGLL